MSRFIGNVSAYAYAVSQGYTGTEEEFATLMASYASVAEEAAESAESASQSATQASASAQTATTKASEASQSATQAGTKASQASTSATQAGASATSASQSAQTATTKASEASASADTAGTKASEASQSATTASSKASEASASATGAQTAQGLAESARDDAIDAKTDAESARDMAQQYAESIDPDNIFSAYATDTASGSVASFADGADDIPVKSCIVNIEPVQSGSGDPSPDNVRPISGWTGAQVVRTGKNLANLSFSSQVPSINTGEMVSPAGWSTDFIRVFQNLDYIASFHTQHSKYILFYDASKTYLGYTTFSEVYSPNSNAYWSQTAYVKLRADGTENESTKAQLEFGTTATSYEPYTGNTYSITFPTEAGTVYGGELDVTNGTLTVDRAMVTYDGSENWKTSLASGGNAYRIHLDTLPQGIKVPASSREVADVVTNILPANSADNTWYKRDGISIQGVYALRIYCSQYNTSDITPWKEFLANNHLTVCYKLATPITYTLTPTEIKSILGDNNVWADAGDVSAEYRADTAMYIEKRIGTEAPMVATDNIVSGSYFMIGDNLYKATANIASGAAVVVGTNATAKTMAEALNEINA